jgi:hypothetical protein
MMELTLIESMFKVFWVCVFSGGVVGFLLLCLLAIRQALHNQKSDSEKR